MLRGHLTGHERPAVMVAIVHMALESTGPRWAVRTAQQPRDRGLRGSGQAEGHENLAN